MLEDQILANNGAAVFVERTFLYKAIWFVKWCGQWFPVQWHPKRKRITTFLPAYSQHVDSWPI